MKPYSLALREKILRADDEHRGAPRALAAFFGVSRAFVEKRVQRRRTGQLAPRPHAGGRKPSYAPAALAVVRKGLQEHTDATWAGLGERLGPRRGLWVSVSPMSRLLTRLGLPTQKKSLHAAERDTPRVQQARAHHCQVIEALDARRLTFVDASGVNLAMTRLYGRAPPGSWAACPSTPGRMGPCWPRGGSRASPP